MCDKIIPQVIANNQKIRHDLQTNEERKQSLNINGHIRKQHNIIQSINYDISLLNRPFVTIGMIINLFTYRCYRET